MRYRHFKIYALFVQTLIILLVSACNNKDNNINTINQNNSLSSSNKIHTSQIRASEVTTGHYGIYVFYDDETQRVVFNSNGQITFKSAIVVSYSSIGGLPPGSKIQQIVFSGMNMDPRFDILMADFIGLAKLPDETFRTIRISVDFNPATHRVRSNVYPAPEPQVATRIASNGDGITVELSIMPSGDV